MTSGSLAGGRQHGYAEAVRVAQQAVVSAKNNVQQTEALLQTLQRAMGAAVDAAGVGSVQDFVGSCLFEGAGDADDDDDAPDVHGSEAAQRVCDAAADLYAAQLQAGPAVVIDSAVAASTCEGARFTGFGRLNEAVPAITSSGVPAERWEQLDVFKDKQRLQVQRVAARAGPRSSGGRAGQVAQRIMNSGEFDVAATAKVHDKLAMVVQHGPKLKAAARLDRLVQIGLDKAALTPQAVPVEWFEEGLPIYVWRAIMLLLCDPEVRTC